MSGRVDGVACTHQVNAGTGSEWSDSRGPYVSTMILQARLKNLLNGLQLFEFISLFWSLRGLGRS